MPCGVNSPPSRLVTGLAVQAVRKSDAIPQGEPATSPLTRWPLHDIATTNIVWCMAYARGLGGGGAYMRNSRAIVLQ